MVTPLELGIVLAGFYVAWNIGANDSANCVGAAVGGRILSYRRAIAIVALFAILGAYLEGWRNMRTVGEGIVVGPEGLNPLSSVPWAALASLISAGFLVMTATALGLPVSTSQSMVGAVAGSGLLISLIQPGGVGASVQLDKLITIIASWALSPAAAALLALIILKVLGPPVRRVRGAIMLNRALAALVAAAAASSAYALGANDVGASAGAVYAFFKGGALDRVPARALGVLGGVALAAGALTYSRKVIYTLGTAITKLDPLTASAAQIGAALTVWSFVQFGIPVSTTQAVVGAVAGAGLGRGTAAVSRRKLGRIGVAWALTPIAASALSFLIGWAFLAAT